MRKFISGLFLSLFIVSLAAPIDEAKRLYNEGDYQQALEKLTALHRRTPRDGSVNYWLGSTLVALDRSDEAIPYFTTAETRGVADAALFLARQSVSDYDVEAANDHFDTYERLLRKNKRNAVVPDEVEAERSRLVLMENMLSRVESIAVIDSIVVDAEDFFKAYKLSPEAGRLVSGSTARIDDADVVFIPQNNSEMLYAQPDTTGNYVLMGADILDDGSIDHPAPLAGDNLGGGGNAEFPFLMADGTTLYYANDGEGSLGGYDIFLTRRSDDGFLQPQNIGMPYNSPYDDYLLAIDETTGAGWWATDRNRIPGKVTIYIFVPSDTRVNVDADSPDLVSLARLDDISLTTAGRDYSEILDRIGAVADGSAASVAQSGADNTFTLPIGSTRTIYRSLSDFKSPQARSAMTRALDARVKVVRLEQQLEGLREDYRKGNHSLSTSILNLEDQLGDARRAQTNYTNEAIRLELSR